MWKTLSWMVTLRISQSQVAQSGESVIMIALVVDLITIRWLAFPEDRCLPQAAKALETSLAANLPSVLSP